MKIAVSIDGIGSRLRSRVERLTAERLQAELDERNWRRRAASEGAAGEGDRAAAVDIDVQQTR